MDETLLLCGENFLTLEKMKWSENALGSQGFFQLSENHFLGVKMSGFFFVMITHQNDFDWKKRARKRARQEGKRAL